jgi:hypothetical protein
VACRFGFRAAGRSRADSKSQRSIDSVSPVRLDAPGRAKPPRPEFPQVPVQRSFSNECSSLVDSHDRRTRRDERRKRRIGNKAAAGVEERQNTQARHNSEPRCASARWVAQVGNVAADRDGGFSECNECRPASPSVRDCGPCLRASKSSRNLGRIRSMYRDCSCGVDLVDACRDSARSEIQAENDQ